MARLIDKKQFASFSDGTFTDKTTFFHNLKATEMYSGIFHIMLFLKNWVKINSFADYKTWKTIKKEKNEAGDEAMPAIFECTIHQ